MPTKYFKNKKITIIGAGFSGLSSACFLAKMGYEVNVLEKHSSPGGRARNHSAKGYTWDMGPSWYWMPDVFERFFKVFGKKPSDFYQLERLNPSYRVKYKNQTIDIPANMQEIEQMFENIEKGSSRQLQIFLKEAKYKYDIGLKSLAYKPSRSILEFMDRRLLKKLTKIDIFTSMHVHVRKFFKNPYLIQLMEFPILFLGSTPKKIPSLYSLMNYADMELGTWYPKGGMYNVVKAMETLAKSLGVTFHYDEEVISFDFSKGSVANVNTESQNKYPVDILVASADYHHIDYHLTPKSYRNYSDKYWQSRSMAPSSIIFYLGIAKKLPKLLHHTLFFDEDFDLHTREIYETPTWPSKPLLYVSATSVTDLTTAPKGKENLMVLIPVAAGLEDTPKIRKQYFDYAIKKIENFIGESIKQHIDYQKSYAYKDFITDYHAFKGNAYGLANTLRQTAFLKPKIKHKKLNNVYFSGQLTVPGPGVPPSLISGELVAKEIAKEFHNR